MAERTQAAATSSLENGEDGRRRIDFQATFLQPYTERLLWDAGIGPGMRVLDVGCGTGEVTLLVADLVGPSGEIVGVDRAAGAVATARRRAETRGLRHVRFAEGDVGSAALDGPFDAVAGRFVLAYLPDPAAVLRQLASALCPNGIVVFQELVIAPGVFSAPPHPLFERMRTWIGEGLARAGVSTDLGLRLSSVFGDAGLPAPALRLDGVVGRLTDPALMEWCAATVRDLLPAIERFGIAMAEEVEIETLAERLIAEQTALGGGVCPMLLGGAIARTSIA